MTLAIRRERTADGFIVRLIGEFDSHMAGVVTEAIMSLRSCRRQSRQSCSISRASALSAAAERAALVEASDHLARDGIALSIVGGPGT